MTLVDRYLRAVRDHLPRAEQEDIINELSDSLRSRIEDEEATRGRPLEESEEAAILKEFGHPMSVAARFRGDERSVTFGTRLVGPELFPTYMKVLAVNAAITLLIALVTSIASISLWSGAGFIVPLAIQFVSVTGVFVLIDRYYINNPGAWDPRSVPTMPDVDLTTLDGISDQLLGKAQNHTVSIATSALEIGLLAIALTAWLEIGRPTTIGFLKPGPGWYELFGPIAVLIAFSLLMPILTLLQPAWTRFRVAGHVIAYAATIVIGAVSLAIGSWVVLADPATATTDMHSQVEVINGIVRVAIASTIFFTAISTALEARRLVRMSRG